MASRSTWSAMSGGGTGLGSGTAGGWPRRTGPGSARSCGDPPGRSVCDVSVIMQLKFQQSFEFVIVPQIQFIVRAVQAVQPVAHVFLDNCDTLVVVQRQVPGMVTVL